MSAIILHRISGTFGWDIQGEKMSDDNSKTPKRGIHQLIADIRNLRKIHWKNRSEAKLVVDYLLANEVTIRHCLNAVTDETDENTRMTLRADHKELDLSAIYKSFWDDIPNIVLIEAHNSVMRSRLGIESEIKDDAIHMLIRGLEYAKYCSAGNENFELLHSPVPETDEEGMPIRRR